jgi:small GTP-binding protein
MIQKKICMLGAFAVGKTSLVSRFVTQGFSEKYQATLGVKIDKKSVEVQGQAVDLILWDLQGEEDGQQLYLSYLRGLSGYLLVVDGTRRATLATAVEIHSTVIALVGPQLPFLVLMNKQDLEAEWEVQESDVRELGRRSWQVVRTSAKTGEDVERAFLLLAAQVMQRSTDVSSAPST